jgi:hypothetical protein
LRLDVFDIQFGSKPALWDPLSRGERYANRSAEMWGSIRSWLGAGGAIEDSDDLQKQLVGRKYGLNGRDEIQLERKADMDDSPDWADALALTFALPVAATVREEDIFAASSRVETEYDPFDPKHWAPSAGDPGEHVWR